MQHVTDPSALTCTVTPDFLSPAECKALIARLEAAGIGATAALYPPSYRDNDRLVLDDEQLAAALYPRIAELTDPPSQGGARWHRQRLNPRFRCCRYRDGQRFVIHRDGAYHASPTECSRLTFMIYLNDAAEFIGGATRYYTDRSGQERLREVTPRQGACIIFDHALWHDGEAVTRGTKYVLRSDVIYSRESASSTAGSVALGGGGTAERPRHLGYIHALTLLGDGTLASGGRDQTIRIWGPELDELQVLRGHQSSVAGLAEARGALWSGDRAGTLRRWLPGPKGWRADGSVQAHAGAAICLLRVRTPERGECVASGGADGVIRLFAEGLRPDLEVRSHDGWIWALAAAPDGLFSGGEDGMVRRLDLGTRTHRASLDLGAPVHALAVAGERLLAGMSDGRIVTLDARTLVPWAERLAHAGAVRTLLVLPDGRVASGGEDDSVALFAGDRETSRYLHADFVRALVQLPDGSLLSGSYDGTLRRYAPDVRVPTTSEICR